MESKLAALTMLAGEVQSEEDFYDTSVRALASGLGVEYAGIGLLTPDKDYVDILSFFNNGKIENNILHDLAPTPCAEVYKRPSDDTHVIYSQNITRLFPDDHILEDAAATSYRGEAFFDSNNIPIGHVFVFDKNPMEENEEDRAFFKLVIHRISSEFARWQSLRALKESEQRFRDFTESASDWFWEQDENLRFTFVSDRYSHVTGRAGQEMYGMTRRDVLKEITRISPSEYEDHFMALDRHEDFTPIEIPIRHEDGTKKIIRISGKAIFDDEGKFKGYRGGRP